MTEPQRGVLERSLTRAQQLVLQMVKDNHFISRRELKRRLDLAPRTVTGALRVLKKRNLIKGIPDLMDMRNVNYVAT